jgi:hypothetical protein
MTKIRIGATVTPALFALLENEELDIDYIKVDDECLRLYLRTRNILYVGR